MKVFITRTAKKGLQNIHDYHCEYSEEYADQFFLDITQFIISNLSELPEMGHVYNERRKLYRVIYKQFNIYYAVRKTGVYALYVIDGKLAFNTDLKDVE